MNTRTPDFSYTVRVSQRAKRARIEVAHTGKVHVVIPKRFNPKHVPALVAQHQKWLTKTLNKIQTHPQSDAATLPELCAFRSLGEEWTITYDSLACEKKLSTDNSNLRLTLNPNNAMPVLDSWLQQYAKRRLTTLLEQKSIELGLPYNKLTIRNQKTRWGSCSAKGNINLNRNLLFLPKELVSYLLVHELCHTVHLNHSPAYWQLVRSYLPGYKVYDQQLRYAIQHVPTWALPIH